MHLEGEHHRVRRDAAVGFVTGQDADLVRVRVWVWVWVRVGVRVRVRVRARARARVRVRVRVRLRRTVMSTRVMPTQKGKWGMKSSSSRTCTCRTCNRM